MPKLNLKLPPITSVMRQTVSEVTQTCSFQTLKINDTPKTLSRFAVNARSRMTVSITRLRTMKNMASGAA